MFREEFDIRNRRFESYNAGETLFGLPNKKYPDLEKASKELNLLDQLYSLYQKVNDQIGKWKEFSWAGIQEEVAKMDEIIEQFGKDRTRLPGVLKQYDAYKDLMTEIESMQALIPIIEALARDSIKPRHWEEIIELTKEDIPYSSETFTLSQLLAAPILDFQEEVEEIAENAVKQEKLEKQLNEDIIAYWDKTELDISSWKNIEQPCFVGGAILDIQEKLEEHIMQLNQMAAMRYVTPFKAEVNGKIGEMALVQETLEKWLRVQGLWTNLVSVFTTGDIVTQMPTVAKKFRNIDKQWLKLMERAADQKNVLKCCKDDILGSSLPSLQEELDYCEKQLEEYLEGKRNKFPRFYFVSNPDLLKILSVGSDPHAVQDDFAKLFDAIEMVSFDETDRRLLTEIIAVKGSAQEKVVLQEGVRCEGNIEDWLCKLEAEMQRSVRAECGRGSQDVFAQKTLKDYFLTYISQVALIGLQMLWAAKVNECLEKTNREKIQELNKKKIDIDNIMTELTALCLDETLDRLKRTRVETLVTIHVRQREIFTEIRSLAQKYMIKDANDFDWVKNTRCSWNPESSHAVVQITDWTTLYSYEFLGAKERLCITPLTDKCYITLAQALSMLYGGAPAGPAGTGKTETVKDLGCTLGIYVVVTNCSDEHKFKDMAKIFKGVCQSGLWGCFDEFNRISLPTLSVVAAQVASITNAKKAGLDRFMFPGEPAKIKLVMACGYFITMNPGYAGRQELPENLKVLFRNMSMMVPDRKVIIAVKLASQGYTKYDMLALKFHVLYKLCEDQLSKTRHYDFGLRNILSVLRTAGSSLREDLTADEEMIMCRTLRDMNLSKFISQDIGPFKSLLEDIFARLQGVANIPQKVYKDVDAEIKRILKDKLLEERPEWKIKVIQLHETSLVRHGFMVCGAVGCGKSAIFNTLTEARSKVIDKITNT
jgi:dynein heavy chain